MDITNVREWLVENEYYETVILENPEFDEAIIGISDEGKLIYSYSQMIYHLMRQDNIPYEEAQEFIDYNTVRALPYIPNAPIIAYDIE